MMNTNFAELTSDQLVTATGGNKPQTDSNGNITGGCTGPFPRPFPRPGGPLPFPSPFPGPRNPL